MRSSISKTTIPVNTLSEQDKSELLSYAYGKGDFPKDLTSANNPVVIVLRQKGKKVSAAYIEGKSLEENLSSAIRQATQSGVVQGSTLEDYSVHFHIIDHRRPVDASYVLGSDAVKMSLDQKDSAYRGSYAIEENKSEQDIRTLLCKNLNLKSSCNNFTGVAYLYAPEMHIAYDASGEVVTFFRGKQIDTNIEFNIEKLQDALSKATNWLLNNVDAKGKFTYEYNPSVSTYSSTNNLIRQFMASRFLARLSQSDKNLLPAHKRNLAYIFATWYKEDARNGWVLYQNNSKLGAIGMLLRTLSASPYYDEYALQAEKLATTIVDLMQPDGSFEPRWIKPSYAYDKDYLLTFYSGEGILALVEYYQKTGQQRRLDAAIKAQDFYVDRYVTHIAEHYYPAYVPRHTISLYKLYTITKDEHYAQAIFVLNDKLIDEMLHTPESEGPADLVGRFYNPKFPQYGTPHSASDAVYVEGLAYAYGMAKLLDDTAHQEKYRQAITLGVHNLLNLQYDQTDAYFVQHPERVIGALRANVTNNTIRTDTTQHTMDAFTEILEVLSK